MLQLPPPPLLFFFNDTAPTEIYTLSLHDALPICRGRTTTQLGDRVDECSWTTPAAQDHFMAPGQRLSPRPEEHTSELQSQSNIVCRLLLDKKKSTPYP